MSASSRTRRSVVAVLLLAGAVVFPAMAMAHAVVYPRASPPGAYEKYVLRVPNEKAVATTRVELRFPSDVRVVSFGDVAGWKLETITDSAKNIVGAVWTGTLQPARFVELPFIAVNPRSNARLVWPAIQTYADGERVEWAGPENGDRPASVTTIAASGDANAAAAPSAPTGTGASDAGEKLPLGLAAAALVLALVSLGLALRPGRA